MENQKFYKQLHSFLDSFKLFFIIFVSGVFVVHLPVYGELSCYSKGKVQSKSIRSSGVQEKVEGLLSELRKRKITKGFLEDLLSHLQQKGYRSFLYNMKKNDLYHVLSVVNQKEANQLLFNLIRGASERVELTQKRIYDILPNLKKKEVYDLLSDLVLSKDPNKWHDLLFGLSPQELYETVLSRFSRKELSDLRKNFQYRVRGAHANRSFISFDISERKSGNTKLKEQNESASFVVIDLETGGLSSKIHEITEVGAIRYVKGRPESVFETLVWTPSNWLKQEAQKEVVKLTNITDKMLQDNSLLGIDAIIEPLIQFLGKDLVVAHNASFDVGFLRTAYMRLNKSIEIFNESIEIYNKERNTKVTKIDEIKKPDGSIIDTLALSRRMLSGVGSHALGNLVKALDIRTYGPMHRAKEDSYCCGEVFLHILDKISRESRFTKDEVFKALADETIGDGYYSRIVDYLLENN